MRTTVTGGRMRSLKLLMLMSQLMFVNKTNVRDSGGSFWFDFCWAGRLEQGYCLRVMTRIVNSEALAIDGPENEAPVGGTTTQTAYLSTDSGWKERHRECARIDRTSKRQNVLFALLGRFVAF